MKLRQLSRRRFLQFSAGAVGFTALAACAPAGAPAGSDGGAAPASEPTTVSLGLTWDASFQPRQAEFNEMFMERHPEYELDATYNTWADHNNVVPTWGAADTLPNVIYVHGSRAFPWAFEGITTSLQSYIDSDEEFDVDGIWAEALRLYNFQGDQHGIPYDHGPLIIGYNKDIFDAAGHEYPQDSWTMEDLRAAAEALTVEDEDNRQWGWSGELPDLGNGGNVNTLGGWGTTTLNDDETAIEFDNEAGRAALQFWTSLITDGLAPTQAETINVADQGPWIAGKVAMAVVPSWETPGLAQFATFNWDVAGWPTGPETRACGSFGSGFSSTKNSTAPDADWAFLREYLSKEGMEFVWGSSGRGSPARKDAYQSWMESEDAPDNAIAYLEALDNYAITGRPYATLAAAEYNDIVSRQTNLLRNGEIDVEAAIAAIAEETPPVLQEAAQRVQG